MKKITFLLTILLFGIYNLNLYLTSSLDNYINSRFFTFSYLASIITIITATVSILILYIRNRNELNNQIKEIIGGPFKYFAAVIISLLLGVLINPVFLLISLFILIYKNSSFKIDRNFIIAIFILGLSLSLGFLLPPKSLSSITAYQREADFNTASLGANNNIRGFTSSDNYELGDWISSINYNPDLAFYKGKTVNVSGFIFNREGISEDEFYVSRFVVTCCAVDARPVGLRARFNWRDNFKVDDWVKVYGKFDILNSNGLDELVINVERLDKIDQPDRPYIY